MSRFTFHHILCFFLVSGMLLLTSCIPPTAPTAANGSLTVVATFSILGDLVQNVAGDHVQVVTLVGPDGDAHTFEPNPADNVALIKAALIFENGLGFEPWLGDLYSAAGATTPRVVVTKGIELLTMGDHGEADPHVWHNVANAVQMVNNIRAALSDADPANADAYAANAESYLAQLAELDAWVREQVATLPVERRKLVTSHDTFGYFAAAYGFQVIGAAMGSISTEAGDPSARDLAVLIEAIKAEKVSAIFAENVANPQLVEQIAGDAGVVVGPFLYTDALGEAGSPGDSYIKMMRYNVDAIVTALNK